MATEVPEDVARRFRAACRAEDRSVSGGLRRLVRAYLGEIDGPLTHRGPAANGTPVETSTIAPETSDHAVPQV